jgi:SOS response regulatory protein OraA/RecX
MNIFEAVAGIRATEALKKGIRKGRAAEKTRVVRRLLAEKGYTVKKIADIVGNSHII